ncbi:MAG: hypothetical protein U0931_35805 [Vulcanimicrobiota bacterium]
MILGLNANVALANRFHYSAPRGSWAARPQAAPAEEIDTANCFEVIVEDYSMPVVQAELVSPVAESAAPRPWRVVEAAPKVADVQEDHLSVPAETADLDTYVQFVRRLHQLYPHASAAQNAA